MTIYMYIIFFGFFGKIKDKIFSWFKTFLKEESGMGTIEVIIIMAVLVALALVFRTFIMDLATSIFDKIKAKTDAAIGSL